MEATNAQGCTTVSAATTINVSVLAAAGITSGYTADTMCDGEFPVFTATPAVNGYTYRFYVNGAIQNLGISTNTFNTSSATYNLLDGDDVMVEVENAAGCFFSYLEMRVLPTTGQYLGIRPSNSVTKQFVLVMIQPPFWYGSPTTTVPEPR